MLFRSLKLEVVDRIVPEPFGGAHRDHANAAEILGSYIAEELDALAGIPTEELILSRYQKYRAMGRDVVEFTTANKSDGVADLDIGNGPAR